MQTKFDKMRAHRERWVAQPIKAQEAAPQVPAVQPFMVVDGVAYVEAPETAGCVGCAFEFTYCKQVELESEIAFDGCCIKRNVIYLKAE